MYRRSHCDLPWFRKASPWKGCGALSGAGTGRGRETLRTLFEEAGCKAPELEHEKAKGSKLPNLVCTLTGESGADILLVTAHFDKVCVGD